MKALQYLYVSLLCLFYSFDKIINKEIPANIVYEDDKVAHYCSTINLYLFVFNLLGRRCNIFDLVSS